ncbi:RNA polymerase sigma factor RpoE [Minicystis rosea]|nr:RNA polymerase sigma factor RpoE [Minicystis rosea]
MAMPHGSMLLSPAPLACEAALGVHTPRAEVSTIVDGASTKLDTRSDRAALTAAMDRHADGDPRAFEALYDLLAPRLLGFLLRITRERAAAEDLTQQTLLHMHRARQSFVRGSDVIPWAFAIARRLAIDARRRRRGEVLFESAEDDAAATDLRVARDAVPDEMAAAHQMIARARAEIERLPEPQRAAYELVRGEGLSVVEAAEVLAITPAAVKQRLYRAYEALRHTLGMNDSKSLRAID